MKNLVILCFCLAVLYCCKKEKAPKYQLPSNPISLITSDSTKVWKLAKRYNNEHRMNMGHCFLAFRMIFNDDMKMRDNNEKNINCGPSIKGGWVLTENEVGHYIKVSSPLIPEILNIKDTFKYFQILELSDSIMILKFKHRQFSNKVTTITDHFVPENLYVEDRDFHY